MNQPYREPGRIEQNLRARSFSLWLPLLVVAILAVALGCGGNDLDGEYSLELATRCELGAGTWARYGCGGSSDSCNLGICLAASDWGCGCPTSTNTCWDAFEPACRPRMGTVGPK